MQTKSENGLRTYLVVTKLCKSCTSYIWFHFNWGARVVSKKCIISLHYSVRIVFLWHGYTVDCVVFRVVVNRTLNIVIDKTIFDLILRLRNIVIDNAILDLIPRFRKLSIYQYFTEFSSQMFKTLIFRMSDFFRHHSFPVTQ